MDRKLKCSRLTIRRKETTLNIWAKMAVKKNKKR
jgi:hypothetical protein